jgi:hypothetical protein
METGLQVRTSDNLKYPPLCLVNQNERLELDFLRDDVKRLKNKVGVSLSFIFIPCC